MLTNQMVNVDNLSFDVDVSGMPIDIVCTLNPAPAIPDTARLAEFVSAVERHTGRNVGHAEICVKICDAAESEDLNSRYRQKSYATNVLSFPAELSIPGSSFLGDLCICWSVVEEEARTQGKSVDHHFAHLFVHGILHLLSFDHESDEEAEVMEDLERNILRDFGIPDPYVVS